MKESISTNKRIPQFVILTVVNVTRVNFELQVYELNTPINCNHLIIEIDNNEIYVNAIITYQRYGRLTNPAINAWIHKYRLTDYDEPIKLIFRLERDGTRHKYSIYSHQGNFISNPLF